MTELKTAAELARMREAGRVVARALAAIEEEADVGVSLLELDEVARRVLKEAGATSSFEHYQPHWSMSPFPAVICASVNDVVVHGIPTGYRLQDGDVVSIDFGAELDGWHGDAARTFIVGEARAEDQHLVATTRSALEAGIAAARPGARMGDIGAAIAQVARSAGFGMLADHGGHGIGRAMHEEPFVPNEGKARRGPKLRAGMTLAIEPMLHAGGDDDYRKHEDGWTILTADGSRAAHWEHTIAVTDDGPQVLTLP